MASGRSAVVREAMAAPAAYPEFQGTVTAVPTAPFWDEPLGAIAMDAVRPAGFTGRAQTCCGPDRSTRRRAI